MPLVRLNKQLSKQSTIAPFNADNLFLISQQVKLFDKPEPSETP